MEPTDRNVAGTPTVPIVGGVSVTVPATHRQRHSSVRPAPDTPPPPVPVTGYGSGFVPDAGGTVTDVDVSAAVCDAVVWLRVPREVEKVTATRQWDSC